MERKLIVYGEILFIENFIIGCVILYITGEIFGRSFSGIRQKMRLAVGGVMCGVFSMEIFLPVAAPVTLIAEVAFAFAVCLVVLGRGKIWKKGLVMILVTYFMGGLTMGLLLITDNTGIYTAAGIYTGDMKAALLALFIAVCSFTARQVVKTVRARKFYGEHVFAVRICIGREVFEAQGFFDTGNQLRDPVSGKPVAVAGESLWKRLEEQDVLRPERAGVVPYETVGNRGLLETLRVDWIEAGERVVKDSIIAKGGRELEIYGEGASGCELLLPRDMWERNG